MNNIPYSISLTWKSIFWYFKEFFSMLKYSLVNTQRILQDGAKIQNFSLQWEIPYLQVAMSCSIHYTLYKHKWNTISLWRVFFFFLAAKGATYYNAVTIAKEVFSHVKKKPCYDFHVWKYHGGLRFCNKVHTHLKK